LNYLAHALLSKNDSNLLVGNFIADHLRGNNFEAYPKEVIEGILLHRRIDSFTDQHEGFRKSKRLFYDGFEKYSGILVDIYFDHLLAKNFDKHAPTSLHNFSQHVYGVYTGNTHLLPQSSFRFLDYVVKNNIYQSYANLDAIEKVLFHLSQRIGHKISLDQSRELYLKNETELSFNFENLFKDARAEFGV